VQSGCERAEVFLVYASRGCELEACKGREKQNMYIYPYNRLSR